MDYHTRYLNLSSQTHGDKCYISIVDIRRNGFPIVENLRYLDVSGIFKQTYKITTVPLTFTS